MFLLHATLLHAWGISETGGLNYPSWSLSAEAFAYALFPILAVLIIKVRFTLLWSILFLVASMFFAQICWPEALRNPSDNLVFTRLENDFGALRIVPEFVLGLAIAKHAKSETNPLVWLSLAVFFILAGFGMDLDALVVLGFAALIGTGLSLNHDTPRIFRRLGELSYCIYMTHALVQIVGFKVIEKLFAFEDGSVPVAFIIPLLGLTMLCAWTMHIWCERPARLWILSLSKPESAGPKASRSFPM
jgi:peptidoglycan/LPS O-acetylase OafA/YrhL